MKHDIVSPVMGEALRSTASPAVEVAGLPSDRVARAYVGATVAVAALGTAWCVAYLTAGTGTEALAYIFVPAGGALTAAAVFQMSRGRRLDPVAARFWFTMLAAVGLITMGYGWLAIDMLAHAAQAHTRAM